MTSINKYNGDYCCFAHWNNAFSEEEVEKIREIEALQTFGKATVGSKLEGDGLKKVRDTDIFFMYHDENTDWLFQKISNMIGTANKDHFLYDVDDFGPMQYTKYQIDGHYTWHWDVYFGFQKAQRKISIVIMLNDPEDYEGGELEVCHTGDFDRLAKLKPNKGDAIFFASWMPHRVLPVTSGERNTLVTWVTGPRES
jgi:PKHD-type hydroxylase